MVSIREHHCLQLFHYIYRHVQVAAMMKREKVHIKHRFDPWHLAKSVRKDLVAASKKRECTELASWTASVVNHLWWCAATSHGDQLLCQEKWKSIIHHVAGIHEWPDFQLFSACGHDELTNQQRRNKEWLPIGSPSHNALKEVAWKPKLLKDICLLADFVQTGCLEVFHGSMAKKYVNKSQHYSYSRMVSRTQLAVIDHNCNVGRGVATTASGDRQYKCVYPKLQKQWVAKPIYEEKTYQFVHDLLRDTILLKEGEIEVPALERPNLPKNIAPNPRGNKEDIIERHVSRFQ